MPGLTRSWHDFDLYESCNVTATHRLLEAIRESNARPRKLIHASTSSVYGRTASGNEDQPTRPISPYGVTKLAAENLVLAYADAYGLPAVILRYFSVYGPRQRPDMGYHQFIAAMLADRPIVVTGDGHQVRGNTYIADCVSATIAAADAPAGAIYNVGGGEPASVWDILRRLEKLAGRPASVQAAPARPGDQRHTLADTTRLTRDLGWRPTTSLDDGLAHQWRWQAETLGGGSETSRHLSTS
jgi:nucleoside-diphosphate-sugar epimerase